MSNRKVAISGGPNNTEAFVTGQQELLVRINSTAPSATSNVTIVGPLDSQASVDSVSVTIASDQFTQVVIPVIIISTGDVQTLITDAIRSISFASCGTADALVTFDAGSTIVALPTGTTINMDAGGLSNLYTDSVFGYDTDTNSGAKLIITYNS
jgi:hypothetical protein